MREPSTRISKPVDRLNLMLGEIDKVKARLCVDGRPQSCEDYLPEEVESPAVVKRWKELLRDVHY
jgi:hypothetical protein